MRLRFWNLKISQIRVPKQPNEHSKAENHKKIVTLTIQWCVEYLNVGFGSGEHVEIEEYVDLERKRR